MTGKIRNPKHQLGVALVSTHRNLLNLHLADPKVDD